MNINSYKSHSTAQQVKFWDGEGWCAGILIGRRIICACCGGIFDVDEILENAREDGIENPIVPFNTWVDISDEIWGDEEEDCHG
jgi:hypothetical protein